MRPVSEFGKLHRTRRASASRRAGLWMWRMCMCTCVWNNTLRGHRTCVNSPKACRACVHTCMCASMYVRTCSCVNACTRIMCACASENHHHTYTTLTDTHIHRHAIRVTWLGAKYYASATSNSCGGWYSDSIAAVHRPLYSRKHTGVFIRISTDTYTHCSSKNVGKHWFLRLSCCVRVLQVEVIPRNLRQPQSALSAINHHVSQNQFLYFILFIVFAAGRQTARWLCYRGAQASQNSKKREYLHHRECMEVEYWV
jgi:hypothetical protein